MKDIILPTYAASLLTDCPALAKLITDCGTSVSLLHQPEDTTSAQLLSDKTLGTALTGPYQSFLRLLLSQYALILRVRLALRYTSEDALKSNTHTRSEDLPEKQLKSIKDVQLSTLQAKFEESVNTMAASWVEFCAAQEGKLLAAIREDVGFPSDIEISEFKASETRLDINKRVIELSIPLPQIETKTMDFATYWQCKVSVLIHSLSNREQRSNAAEVHQKTFKLLKPLFAKIAKDEATLLKSQADELSTLLNPLAFSSKFC